MARLYALVGALLSSQHVAGESTQFDTTMVTAPGLLQNQFVLQEEIAILMSAGFVYYDGDNSSLPTQAFEVTDGNGDPQGPFLRTTTVDAADSYVLDVTSLNTGTGIRPFFRGEELTPSSLRGWRLDFWDGGFASGTLWTTIMSGPITDLGGGFYELSVDLNLLWSEQGDNLNRLGQGQFSHIALGVGDFRDFTMEVLSVGSVQLSANVITSAPTAVPSGAPSTSEPTTSPTPDGIGQPGASTTTVDISDGTSTTEEPQNRDGGGSNGGGGDANGGDGDAQDRSEGGSEGGGGYYGDDDCGKKGMGKHGKHCKGKKGKNWHGYLVATEASSFESGGIAVGSAVLVFFIAGGALVAYRQRQVALEGYAVVQEEDSDPVATIPTAFAAFGTMSTEELKLAAAKMRMPPTAEEACKDTN